MPTSRLNKPNIIVTMGDPSGIGPEVTVKALASSRISGLANFLVIGDGSVINKVCVDMKLKFRTDLIDLKNVPRGKFAYGRQDALFGKAATQYLDRALDLLRRREADCLVTAPLNKASVIASGAGDFEGHTEYLAKKTLAKKTVMMFVGKKMKTALVTRHVALKDVPARLSCSAIYDTIAVTHEYLMRYFHIRNPRIGVAGLNPHAGEGGIFGSEEWDVIVPAIERARKKFGRILGPVAPDIIFNEQLNGKFDAVVAMYHDQALIPFKILYFKDGVNLTLGLPFIRTSPDHGTAFDIAGRGEADATSMKEAIALACRLSSIERRAS